ncbi:protein involved in polysaccharide export, contains SLBB domain of the beta-grasp fold [Lysobacter sp. yr284]|nr:protein involved in polysaccharide export, contains SLBB domain of the beta-grasp fold [Lysobacter sp. yr284]
MSHGVRRRRPVRPAQDGHGAAAAPVRRWPAALARSLLLAALCLLGPIAAPAFAQAPAPAAAAAGAEYRIAAGDELALKFFYAPELNETATVRPDGRIHLQLVGEVRAAGQTPQQLADALKRAYAGSLRYPEVSVEVEKGFARQQVFVGGEVGRPGAQPLLPGLTVMRALIVAQGPTDRAALNRVAILRRDESGATRVIRVDAASQARRGADDGNDPPLQPFDVVLAVPSRISRVNKWIDQYVRRNLPVNVGFSYDLNDNNRRGD